MSAAIDAHIGSAKPSLTLAIGTKRYRELEDTIVRKLLARLPDTMHEAKDYAARALDVEQLIIEKTNELTPEQYESILRPKFKDDEMLMVMVGAVLGFMVGEAQVYLVEHFSR